MTAVHDTTLARRFGGADTRRFVVTLPADLAEEVRAMAQAHDRSADEQLSALVVEVLGTVRDAVLAQSQPDVTPYLAGAAALIEAHGDVAPELGAALDLINMAIKALEDQP